MIDLSSMRRATTSKRLAQPQRAPTRRPAGVLGPASRMLPADRRHATSTSAVIPRRGIHFVTQGRYVTECMGDR